MNEKALRQLGSDITSSQEYFATFRRTEHLEPEKALLQAVLKDAIHCLRKYRRAKDHAGKELFQEAESWIMQKGDDWIFSFDNVCELLGLDPEGVRGRLQERRTPVAARPQRRRRSASAARAA